MLNFILLCRWNGEGHRSVTDKYHKERKTKRVLKKLSLEIKTEYKSFCFTLFLFLFLFFSPQCCTYCANPISLMRSDKNRIILLQGIGYNRQTVSIFQLHSFPSASLNFKIGIFLLLCVRIIHGCVKEDTYWLVWGPFVDGGRSLRQPEMVLLLCKNGNDAATLARKRQVVGWSLQILLNRLLLLLFLGRKEFIGINN